MRYFIAILGTISIILVTIINFYPDKVSDMIDNVFGKHEYIMAKANDYYLDNNNISYVKNYTDDVSNKEELLNYIYYVVNTGSSYADGECTKDYTDCTRDLNEISNDEDTLSLINNFVHPFNSFKTISFTYNEHGKFSLIIEHIYNDEEISKINYIVSMQIDKLITDKMSTEVKIKNIHDYIIDNTSYDTLKTDNINDTTYKSNTAYGVLIQGKGICSGYSDAIAIFLNRLGIENYKISNDTHIWNLIYLNGVWVHLDATWDDPVSEFNENRDTYFLIDTKNLEKLDDGTHYYNKNIYKEAV